LRPRRRNNAAGTPGCDPRRTFHPLCQLLSAQIGVRPNHSLGGNCELLKPPRIAGRGVEAWVVPGHVAQDIQQIVEDLLGVGLDGAHGRNLVMRAWVGDSQKPVVRLRGSTTDRPLSQAVRESDAATGRRRRAEPVPAPFTRRSRGRRSEATAPRHSARAMFEARARPLPARRAERRSAVGRARPTPSIDRPGSSGAPSV
jgi:hypothetical protein